MANDRVERQLEQLKTLRADGRSEAAIQDLRKSLNDKVNVIVAKAAVIAGEWQARALLPDLLQTFSRLLDAPESDPQCSGKNAIAKALKDFEIAESAVFLRGIRHHQFEPTWGGRADSAGTLRAMCALALVQCTDLPRYEIMLVLIDALTEADAGVRSDAARALEQMGGREVQLLLRLKARSGDPEVGVTGQVLESILQMEGGHAVPFVGSFLKHANEEISQEAALALGASRLPEAVDALIKEWSKSKLKHNGDTLLRAISASRQEVALDFLLDQVRTGQPSEAEDALSALALHRDSVEIVQRVERAVSTRLELRDLFRKAFRE